MPDREKVISGLRDIDMFIAGRLGYEKAKNFLRTVDEAIVLLKKQEAVEPKVIGENGFGDPVHACGECGHLITESMNYCSQCGRKVGEAG